MSAETELLDIFSDPHAPTVEGVIAVGGRITSTLLRAAYENGIFPWPHEGYPLLWFSPDERGVIDFSELHWPRTFKKWHKKNRKDFSVCINTQFENVVRECQVQKRSGQSGTWITDEMRKGYVELHRSGGALSVEIMRNDKLVAGIYGVMSSHYFSCESMFHKEDNTSKLALIELVEYLTQNGHHWMDIQMVTSVSESFGGKLIAKTAFLKRLGF